MAFGGMASRAARRTVSSKLHTSLYAVQDAGCVRRRDGAHAKPIMGQPGGIAMRFEMRLMSTAVTMLLAAASLGASVSLAQAQTCTQLWTERNQYYKDAGYCFKTARAIRYFGNAGCTVDKEDDLKLAPGVLARIDQITRLERTNGCR